MALFSLTPKQEYEKALEFRKRYDDSCTASNKYLGSTKYFEKYLEHLKKAAMGQVPEAMAEYGKHLTGHYQNFTDEGVDYLKKAAEANVEEGIKGYSTYLIQIGKKEEALTYLERLPLTIEIASKLLPLIGKDYPRIISILTTVYKDLSKIHGDHYNLLLEAYQETKQEDKELELLKKRYETGMKGTEQPLIKFYEEHHQLEKAFDLRIEIAQSRDSSMCYTLFTYIREQKYPFKLFSFFSSMFSTYTSTTIDGYLAYVPQVMTSDRIVVTNQNYLYAKGLGMCYYYGCGVTKKISEAITLFNKVVGVVRDSELILLLGNHYYELKDYTNAAKYYNQFPGSLPITLYNNEDRRAYVQKAKTYFETKDYPKAFNYLNKALPQAEQHPFIYDHLARCYINGWGTTKDDTQGFEYTKKAASLDYPEGIHLLGYCYAMGRGVPKDEKKAYDIYIKAEAKYHLPQTQRNIGILYASGHAGLKKDYYEARVWFTKAANQNYKLGIEALQWINNKIKEELEHPDLPCVESEPYN